MRTHHHLRTVIRTAAIGLIVIVGPAGAETAGPVTKISWENNMLTLHAPEIPGDTVAIWYLEAFCRRGSTDRDWGETVVPHQTEKIGGDANGQQITLRSTVEPGVTVTHDIRVVPDGVAFALTLHNPTDEHVDIEWAQPCMRVGAFTGRDQEDYFHRCFIFTESGREMLDETTRTDTARYTPGQVYVPEGIDPDDVNPRPVSPEVPVNHLIGCVSKDDRWLLAMAWDHTQELFQGVIVCIHADFRIGGLSAGETKHLKGRVYLLPNDLDGLLSAYARDFPAGSDGK